MKKLILIAASVIALVFATSAAAALVPASSTREHGLSGRDL